MKATRKVLTEMEVELCDRWRRWANSPKSLTLVRPSDEASSAVLLANGTYCNKCDAIIVRAMGKARKRPRKAAANG